MMLAPSARYRVNEDMAQNVLYSHERLRGLQKTAGSGGRC